MAKKKYYAVATGREPGIYSSWDECKKQVDHFPGAVYKSFPSLAEAKAFLTGLPAVVKSPEQEETSCSAESCLDIYVDGSYSKGQYSWAFVVYQAGEVVHTDCGQGANAEAVVIRNVAGELAATMRAIQWADQNREGLDGVVIHHDYLGISAWAQGAWKANNPFTQSYVRFVKPFLGWIRFIKVQGHSGVAGNELADKLAKQALQAGKTADFVE